MLSAVCVVNWKEIFSDISHRVELVLLINLSTSQQTHKRQLPLTIVCLMSTHGTSLFDVMGIKTSMLYRCV